MIRKILVAALITAMGIGTVGCAGADGKDQSEDTASHVKYDGQTLFRGVFLGSGAVAQGPLADVWQGKTLSQHISSFTPAQIASAQSGLPVRISGC